MFRDARDAVQRSRLLTRTGCKPLMRTGCERLQDFLRHLCNNLDGPMNPELLPDLSCRYPIRGSLSAKERGGVKIMGTILQTEHTGCL